MQSGRCCCDVRSRNCDRPFLLEAAGNRGWRARDVGDCCRRDVGGQMWEAKTMRSCHPLSASLWAYSRRWREGAVRAGTADGAETASFHDHQRPSLRWYSHILLDSFNPRKEPVCRIACGGGGAGVSIDAWQTTQSDTDSLFSLGLCYLSLCCVVYACVVRK